MLDLLIKNGLVIDGSGSPGLYASVLVENEQVVIHRGDPSHLEAAQVIDATTKNIAFLQTHCRMPFG